MTNRESNPDKLIKRSKEELHTLILSQAADIENVQRNTLFDILKQSEDSEYGKMYDFSDTQSVSDYQKKVPIRDYRDMKPWIDRIYEGEDNVLYSDETVYFLFSSGTTGDAKTFPESRSGDHVKSIINTIRSMEIARMVNEVHPGKRKYFAITNTSYYGESKSGVPIGTASGVALKQAKSSGFAAVPAKFMRMGQLDADTQNEIFAFYALSNEDVVELICNNPAHFIRVLDVINGKTERILSDIEKGTLSVNLPEDKKAILLEDITPNPERAATLRSIYEKKGILDITDFWPEFSVVDSWLSGSVGRIVKEYRYIFPEHTLFIHWGYGASESKVDVVTEPEVPYGIPMLFGTFYECRDVRTGEISLLHEVKEGRLYEMILTTYSGLYRYNLMDIVRFRKGEDGLLRIEFVCKSGDSGRPNGQVIYSAEISEMIEEYEKNSGMAIRFFQAKSYEDGMKLYAEGVDEFDKDGFEAFMKKKLSERGITLLSVTEYEQGYRNSLYGKVLQGKSISSTKLPVFIPTE